MKIHKRKNQKNRIMLLIVIAAIAIIALGVWCIENKKHTITTPQSENSNKAEKPLNINDVDYSGLTEEEAERSQDGKKNSGTKQDTTTQNNNVKKNIGVAISYADINNNKLEIRAFATGIIEGTGKCTATVSKGGTSINATSSAFIDASTTICEPIYLEKNQFSSGTWKVIVKFESPDAIGVSTGVDVEVE